MAEQIKFGIKKEQRVTQSPRSYVAKVVSASTVIKLEHLEKWNEILKGIK